MIDGTLLLTRMYHPQYWMDSPDLAAALAGRLAASREERPVLLMAHQPPQIKAAAAAGVALQVSGHVHGGQTWPLHLGAYLANPYFSGLSRHPLGTWIYVSEGAVGWGERMRLLSTPENTVITLLTEAGFAAAELEPDTGMRLSEAAAIASVVLVPLYIGGWVRVAWQRRQQRLSTDGLSEGNALLHGPGPTI
eukprot:SAG22_NODE_32_length_27675_cov_12.130119_11_plen_193_part_00